MPEQKISLSDAIDEAVAKKRAGSVSLDDAIADAIAKKQGGGESSAPVFFTPYPTNEAGQRIDASGKVVEPGFLDKVVAIGHGENPVATLALDLLPLMNPATWRAAVLGASKVDTAVRNASPITKGGVTYAALKAANHYTGMLPEPLPTVVSIMASQIKPKVIAPAAEAVSREMTPLGFVKPSAPQEKPIELTRRVASEAQAASGKTREELLREFTSSFNPPKASAQAAPAAAVAEAAPIKLKLTVDEAAAALKMRAAGKTDQQIRDLIQAARNLQVKFGLDSNATVADIVKKANETGRMVR